jgi:hypothetical protein
MNSPTEEHLGAALRDLVAEQPFTPDLAAIGQRARQSRRRDRIRRGGIGAGVVAVAAVAAIGVAGAFPSGPAVRAQAAGAHPGQARASARPASVQAPLVRLAAYLAAERRPAGDATLMERETDVPGHASIKVWDLYADDGRYFFSPTEAGLPAQVRENNNQGGGQFGREVAAAVDAVTGNLDTAALKMAWAPDTTPVPAWLSAQVKDISAGGTQLDNYVWEGCEDALIAGAGNPQVRAGVLRLVSALPGIAVTHGVMNGQPALTLTAGAAELGRSGVDPANPKIGTGPAYQEAITVNASTGIPLQIASGPAGHVTGIVSYVVTRVSLAGIAAGRF